MILLSVPDLLKKKITIWALTGAAVPVLSSLIYKILAGGNIWKILLTAAVGSLPGAVLILLWRFTKKVGPADGILLCAIGMTEDFIGALMVLCISSFVMSVLSIILLMLKKVRKETALPFIPFMSLGYLLWKVGTIGAW